VLHPLASHAEEDWPWWEDTVTWGIARLPHALLVSGQAMNRRDMTDAGLLRRTELGDHVWRFEPIGEGEHAHATHPHFVCVDCGSVSCLNEIKLTEKSLRASRQIGEVTEILLRGHCKICS